MNKKKNTPMMEQYLAIKESYKDTILFYRMGDFYEMFLEDAKKAASILEIALTSRNKNDAAPIPMCGIPFRAADNYIAKLIKNGCKVAVCEQMEDAAVTKGLVKRQVIRVITPGMILNEELLDKTTNNFLLALSKTRDVAGIAYLDISTGTFKTTQVQSRQSKIPLELIDEALKVDPKEILLPSNFEKDPIYRHIRHAFSGRQITYLDKTNFHVEEAKERLLSKFKTRSLEGFGAENLFASISAAGAILSYVQDTQMQDINHIFQITPYDLKNFMVIDDRSCKNLEILTNIQTLDKKGTLIHVLDRTVTAMGSRLIKTWVRYPLIDKDKICQRLDCIEEITKASHIHQLIISHLKSVYDLERLGSKISMGQGNARDMIALKNSLKRLPLLFKELCLFKSPLLNGKDLEDQEMILKELGSLADLIEEAIRENAGHLLNEGGLINDGYNPELDELLLISRDGKSWIAKTEATEKEKTKLSSLKIKYNKVFGYFIEVSRGQSNSVPDHYIRKQTLVNAERFITDEMKQVESTILNAQDKRNALEYKIFCIIRDKVISKANFILKMADFIANIDVLQGLALAASENGYTKPVINEHNTISIEDGRHPVVEKLIKGERYVPNSIEMDDVENQILLITGPNMAGKSTVLRQVALTVLMTQMGSFVPAQKASLGIVDRIFTRVGALDNLSSGQSTFMVEMEETANIVNNATQKSLIILDEIGRGTSTYDGMSIAWAVAEHLHDLNNKGVKTLFATHYHELTKLEETKPRIKNFNIAVKEFNDNIVFLRRLVKGGTNKSYGIQVARLAGMPDIVINNAKHILSNIDKNNSDVPKPLPKRPRKKGKKRKEKDDNQMELFNHNEQSIKNILEKIDISSMTPLEAINLLNDLKQKSIK
ncbi:MAG: DNA mismatch repair protein MutS [Desulfobacula sp.]|uniref:DNA mismatch repair protein MutS n=1 Tax=Desulfobacula sp. TaxID=2593537 RepID=UPI0025C505D2|nr:DNA mismatch repair protein MutS [Desulfobacula sp.]MCD4721505.1 DNA mismatch repair protein MutS [Desulfobacula sp.]